MPHNMLMYCITYKMVKVSNQYYNYARLLSLYRKGGGGGGGQQFPQKGEVQSPTWVLKIKKIFSIRGEGSRPPGSSPARTACACCRDS